jgi:hypothetical protein
MKFVSLNLEGPSVGRIRDFRKNLFSFRFNELRLNVEQVRVSHRGLACLHSPVPGALVSYGRACNIGGTVSAVSLHVADLLDMAVACIAHRCCSL